MSVTPQLDQLIDRMNWYDEKGILNQQSFNILFLDMLAILVKEVSNLSESLASIDRAGILIHNNQP